MAHDEHVVLRVYMRISRSAHPELIARLDGKAPKDQSDIIRALVYRGHYATWKEEDAGNASERKKASGPVLTAQAPEVSHRPGLLKGILLDDIDSVFEALVPDGSNP